MAPSEPWEQPNCIKNTSTQCAWVGRIHIMHLGPLKDLYGPQKGSFWLQKALLGAPEVLGGPWRPDLVPTAPHWPLVRLMVKTHFDLISGPFWAPGGFKRAPFCPERAFWGTPRSSEGPNGPDLVPTAPEGPAEVKHRVTTLFWPDIKPLEGPQGPKKGYLGPIP